jgi:hypothetical protein
VRAGIFSPTTCEALPLLHSRDGSPPVNDRIERHLCSDDITIEVFHVGSVWSLGNGHEVYTHRSQVSSVSYENSARSACTSGNHPAPNTSGATVTPHLHLSFT